MHDPDISTHGDVPMDDGDEVWEPFPQGLGDDEAFSAAVRETIEHRLVVFRRFILFNTFGVSAHPRQFRDSQTWHQCLVREQLNWASLLPSLVDAYLSWKYPDFVTTPSSPSSPGPLNSDPEVLVSYDFSITTIDLYTLSTSINVPRTASMTAPEALMFQGYMATSPISPSLAISIKTLELLRVLRMRKASLSVEAYAKVLSDLYGVSVSSILTVVHQQMLFRYPTVAVIERRCLMPLTCISSS
jgi:hypothetical protein